MFLLITDNPERLLPTVRSRCVELELTSLPEAVLLDALRRRFPGADTDTLRSAAAAGGGFLGQAITAMEEGVQLPPQTVAFARALAAGDTMALLQVLTPLEKQNRDALGALLQGWCRLLESALVCRSGGTAVNLEARALAAARTGPALYHALQAVRQGADYLLSNVSPAAVCGSLFWALTGTPQQKI